MPVSGDGALNNFFRQTSKIDASQTAAVDVICNLMPQRINLRTFSFLATSQIADFAVIQNVVDCVQQCSASKCDWLCHFLLKGGQLRILYEFDAG
jgi:hypothetical protein